MQEEKGKLIFHIQFNRADPAHLHVASILNSKTQRGEKAKCIVNAIIFYESHYGASEINHRTLIDEKHLEAAINRILQNRENDICDREKSNAAFFSFFPLSPVSPPSNQVHKQPQPSEDIMRDEIDGIGADEVNRIANTLKMFKTKR
jgi:hypothetical protein